MKPEIWLRYAQQFAEHLHPKLDKSSSLPPIPFL
jgi:hypothetical protein